MDAISHIPASTPTAGGADDDSESNVSASPPAEGAATHAGSKAPPTPLAADEAMDAKSHFRVSPPAAIAADIAVDRVSYESRTSDAFFNSLAHSAASPYAEERFSYLSRAAHVSEDRSQATPSAAAVADYDMGRSSVVADGAEERAPSPFVYDADSAFMEMPNFGRTSEEPISNVSLLEKLVTQGSSSSVESTSSVINSRISNGITYYQLQSGKRRSWVSDEKPSKEFQEQINMFNASKEKSVQPEPMPSPSIGSVDQSAKEDESGDGGTTSEEKPVVKDAIQTTMTTRRSKRVKELPIDKKRAVTLNESSEEQPPKKKSKLSSQKKVLVTSKSFSRGNQKGFYLFNSLPILLMFLQCFSKVSEFTSMMFLVNITMERVCVMLNSTTQKKLGFTYVRICCF
jgi:hypothetical protein